MSANSIVAPATSVNNPQVFDTMFVSSGNHGGARISTTLGTSEYLGGHDIIVLFGNELSGITYLSPQEARELAAALQALATHIEEIEGTPITRRTEAGAPAFEEGI